LRKLLPKPSPAYGSRFKNNHRHEGANIKMKAYSQARAGGWDHRWKQYNANVRSGPFAAHSTCRIWCRIRE